MKKTRRLVMLALALVLTFAMATTTTFAWFTMGNVVAVRGISGQATAAEGLLVSPTAEGTFLSSIDLEVDEELVALTMGKSISIDDTSKVVSPFEMGGILDDIKWYNSQGAQHTEETGFIEKEIYFKSDVATEIALSKISLKVEGTGTTQSAPDGFVWGDIGTDAEHKAIVTSIINALRLAVFNASNELVAVYSFQIDDETSDWDTPADGGDYDGLNLAAALYQALMIEADPINTPVPVTGDGINVNNPLTLTENATTGYHEATSEQVVASLNGTDNSFCTIVIWVEGLDGHCLNNIITQQFEMVLQFTGIDIE